MAQPFRGTAPPTDASRFQSCCLFVFLFNALLGVVVPALIARRVLEQSAWWRRGLQQPPALLRGGGGGGLRARVRRALLRARWAADRAEAALHSLCDLLDPLPQPLLPLAWVTVLYLLHTVALLLHLPPAAQPRAAAAAAG